VRKSRCSERYERGRKIVDLDFGCVRSSVGVGARSWRRPQVNHGSENGNDAQPTRPGVALNPGNVLHAVKLGSLNQELL
jgi:hypothetical protein